MCKNTWRKRSSARCWHCIRTSLLITTTGARATHTENTTANQPSWNAEAMFTNSTRSLSHVPRIIVEFRCLAPAFVTQGVHHLATNRAARPFRPSVCQTSILKMAPLPRLLSGSWLQIHGLGLVERRGCKCAFEVRTVSHICQTCVTWSEGT